MTFNHINFNIFQNNDQLYLYFCDNSAIQYTFLNKMLKFIQVEALNKVDSGQIHINFACDIKYIRKA